MTIWPPRKSELTRPVYRSLANALLGAIEKGIFTKGDRLPTHRDLAYELGISIQTVSRAYEELIRIGAIAGEIGRGSYVLGSHTDSKTPHFYLPAEQRRELIDLSILKPVCEQVHIDAMRSALRALSDNLPADVVQSFRPSSSRRDYLVQAQKWLKICGLDTPAESILLTNGSTASMTVALMTAARSGDHIVTEEFGHHTLKPLTSYLGMKLSGCATDGEGLVPDELERFCLTHHPKALYIMPDGLNPKARIMGLSRRKEIAAITRKYDVTIIENDAWGPVQNDRIIPIAGLAPERTLYFTGFSKCIMPGLRSGYLVIPDTLVAAAKNRHLVTNWMATAISMEIVTRLIAEGTALELLEWQKTALAQRNKVAKEQLEGVRYLSSPNGLHIWLPLPEAWSEDLFVAQLRENGVAVGPGSAFAVETGNVANAVRVCLGPTTVEELEAGLSIIRNLHSRQPILESLNL